MHSDPTDSFRQTLLNDPPAFLDRVNTPWEHVPDLEEYNQKAYNRIVFTLAGLKRAKYNPGESNTQGILVLGEAGTGKTHLLMRVARNLSQSNHILFVRRPANEDAVTQHVWAEVVRSLAISLPTSGTTRIQLDDLLAHVFSAVLIPEFERDIEEGKDAERKRRWVDSLREDPFHMFDMLGEGERRQKNLDYIRRRTLTFLDNNHPDVDQTIAHVLITYCFVSGDRNKRVLRTWLSGQDVDVTEAKALGLPSSWVTMDENSSEASIQQQREEQALRAIRTLGILSTYYQPLILAFDQLEGLREESRLTRKWGNTVLEIFNFAPNFLIITCIFPSLWESWFSNELVDSVSDRIAQQKVTLEAFGPQHGLKMLATHMQASFLKHVLPTPIYPFTDEDVTNLCSKASSPRKFIQSVRSAFSDWLESDPPATQTAAPEKRAEIAVTEEAIDTLLRSTLLDYENGHRSTYDSEIPIEEDAFGRVKSIIETMLKNSTEKASFARASCGSKVMPPNLVVKWMTGEPPLCLPVLFSEGNSFAARIRNFVAEMVSGQAFKQALILRDRRCKQIGRKSSEHIETLEQKGGVYLQAGNEEMSLLNAIYDVLVAIEEHDLSIGSHEVDKRQFMSFLQREGTWRRSQLIRAAANVSEPLRRLVGMPATPHADRTPTAAKAPTPTMPPSPELAPTDNTSYIRATLPSASGEAFRSEASPQSSTFSDSASSVTAEVLLGSTTLQSPNVGLLGRFKDDSRLLAVSFTKPQCMVLLGYMGSGKSYALGVLMENALLSIPNVSHHQQALCVVAFNYRKNSEARFEHSGFRKPNNRSAEVEALRAKYNATPLGVKQVNVFGYGPELSRRQAEYDGVTTFPIQFRGDELGAEHWEILMRPPNPQTEYMDIVRAVIKTLFYKKQLSYKNLEKAIHTDERFTSSQRKHAVNRLSFVHEWLCDERKYEWGDVLAAGSLNVIDLRMQTMTGSDALKLCLVITDLVRRTKNNVNKVIVFDEAHEYVDSKDLTKELENAITQIRHDGLSFILASQFPDRIPASIFKYLLTRMIFKLPDQKAIDYLRKAAPNLSGLSPQKVSNLDLEQGICFVQTDDDCTDTLLRFPQLVAIRPRCTLHGGETIRSGAGKRP
jgi:hypothetical protein